MIQINKVLYITHDDLYLYIQNENIIIKNNENVEKLRVPLLLIEGIVIFGNTTISNYVIKICSDYNIIISYVSVYGNYYGRFCGKNNGNIFLRKKQYEMYGTTKSIELVKNIILGKVLNSRNVLLRVIRDCEDIEKKNNLIESSNKILEISKNLKDANTIDSIRGIEGSIANIYFSTFDNMLKVEDERMLFQKRSKRPPENYCNCLLSLLYTLLTMNVTSALETYGLDSSCGYMHTLKSGRASLSCDLVEEFRAPIVDKFVINLINRKQITQKDFEFGENGIVLTKQGLKKVLDLWEKHKENEVFYPLYNKKVKIKVVPYLQAQLMAQYIRGDIEKYPPFKWK